MFLEYLEDQKLEFLLKPPPLKKFLPKGTFDVYRSIKKAIANGEKIWIQPDCDPDGYFSALAWKYTLDKLSYTNYEVGVLKNRNHHVSWKYIKEQLDRGFTTIILVDSSTNDIDLINNISNYATPSGLQTTLLIIDHHQGKYTYEKYPENVVVVNPKLESPEMPYYAVSAGMVNALVCDYVLFKHGFIENKDLYIFGYISMYSDSCSACNPYIAAIMRNCFHDYRDLPRQVQVFWDQYSSLDRNFVSFKMIPLINALIRREYFREVDKLFFHPNELGSPEEFLAFAKNVKNENKELVNSLLAKAKVEEFLDVVIATLPSNLDKVCYNFMGFIATKLANSFNKIALCVYEDLETGMIIGSARDYLNRDILNEFATFFEGSQGHTSAFGVAIEKERMHIIPEIISKATLQMRDEFVIFDYATLSSDKEIEQMAYYNEMAIVGIPKAAIRVKVQGDFKISGSAKRQVAQTKTMSIVAIGSKIERNSEVVCVPGFNGGRLECMVV